MKAKAPCGVRRVPPSRGRCHPEEACCLAAEILGTMRWVPLRGQAYRETRGFGSPLCEGTGSRINREAALKLGLGEEDFSRLRYDWMASLADQIQVTWRNAVTYYVLGLGRELPFQPSLQGWRERRWVDLAEVRQLAKGHTAWLLAHGLKEAVARAAELG